jgi:hypothetical protein
MTHTGLLHSFTLKIIKGLVFHESRFGQISPFSLSDPKLIISVLIMKVTNKMQLYRLIYYSESALHVSGDVFAHHQEHLTLFTISGSIHTSSCQQILG